MTGRRSHSGLHIRYPGSLQPHDGRARYHDPCAGSAEPSTAINPGEWGKVSCSHISKQTRRNVN